MKKLMALFLVLFLFTGASAQNRGEAKHYRSDGFYIMFGAADGPNFSSFFDYVNSGYQALFHNSSERLDYFGSNVAFQLGYISRFQRNFGIDIGITVYSLKSKGQITNHNSDIDAVRLWHELDYQVGIFTATFPLIFEFVPRQKIIPYVGIGLSAFAMRLDDFRNLYTGSGLTSEVFRDTRTCVGAHFEGGVGFKITQKLWADGRARWHAGSGHLATLENNFGDFSINQSVSQYTLGVDYFFR